MACDLTPECVVIVVEREVPAVAHHGAAALVGNDLQSVARQLQCADDLRPEQAAHVGAVRVGEVLIEHAADGGATDIRVALEDEHVEARASEIAGCYEAVMARADDDDVMAATIFYRSHAALGRCGRSGGDFVRRTARTQRRVDGNLKGRQRLGETRVIVRR